MREGRRAPRSRTWKRGTEVEKNELAGFSDAQHPGSHEERVPEKGAQGTAVTSLAERPRRVGTEKIPPEGPLGCFW